MFVVCNQCDKNKIYLILSLNIFHEILTDRKNVILTALSSLGLSFGQRPSNSVAIKRFGYHSFGLQYLVVFWKRLFSFCCLAKSFTWQFGTEPHTLPSIWEQCYREYITMFWSRVKRFVNDCQEWYCYEWKSLLSRLMSDKNGYSGKAICFFSYTLFYTLNRHETDLNKHRPLCSPLFPRTADSDSVLWRHTNVIFCFVTSSSTIVPVHANYHPWMSVYRMWYPLRSV